MAILARIRRKIRKREYILTQHAKDRMREDDIRIFDIEHAILQGGIRKKEIDDPRGTRWEIVGPSSGGIELGVVLRFLPSDDLLIITAYIRY